MGLVYFPVQHRDECIAFTALLYAGMKLVKSALRKCWAMRSSAAVLGSRVLVGVCTRRRGARECVQWGVCIFCCYLYVCFTRLARCVHTVLNRYVAIALVFYARCVYTVLNRYIAIAAAIDC